MFTKERHRTMTKRRGQAQHKLLCSEATVSTVEDATRHQIGATIAHLPRAVSKKDVTDALVRVAVRHADEVTAELLRMYGITPTDDRSRHELNSENTPDETTDDVNGENDS